jgi:hypothetical protein
VKEFLAGFTRDATRRYTAIAEERQVSIPLRDFVASNQVHSVGVAPFNIWVWQNGQEVFAEALQLEIGYECCFCQKRYSTDEESCLASVENGLFRNLG